MLLLLPVASCCFLLPPAASCFLLLPPAASCCLLLPPAASYCLLLLPVTVYGTGQVVQNEEEEVVHGCRCRFLKRTKEAAFPTGQGNRC